VEGWDQKRGSLSLGVRVGAIRLAQREIRRSRLGAVRVRAGCASETLPTAMSPGSIGRQTEAEAAPGLVVGGRSDAEGRAAESGGRLGHEETDRWVGLLDGG
jgi:hypothetical protein